MRTRQLDVGIRNIVGQALHDIRKRQGFKSKEVKLLLEEQGIDITNSALSKLEGGHRSINDYELLAFSRIYGTDIADIYQTALLQKGTQI